MTVILFIIGMMTSLGCGLNIVATKSYNWQTEATWILGGLIGAAMMVAAIWLGRG